MRIPTSNHATASGRADACWTRVRIPTVFLSPAVTVSFWQRFCHLVALGHDQSLSVNNVPPPGQYKITGFVEKILEKTDTHGACTSWGTTSRSAVINTGCARQLDSIYTFSKDKPSIGPGMLVNSVSVSEPSPSPSLIHVSICGSSV